MITVSVIIPVYNRAQTVLDAIRSVLEQTFRDFELLIIDDASTDDIEGSLASVGDDRVRLVRLKENRGAAGARNAGIRESKGLYVAFLDSDDQWLPEKLERQLQFMRAPATASRASCTGFALLTPRHPEGEVRIDEDAATDVGLSLGCRVSPGSTLVYERSLFEEIGALDETMRRLEDWDWLLRYTKRAKLTIVPEVLARIDAQSHQGLLYEDVANAAQHMKQLHFTDVWFPDLSRARFLSALQTECAWTAYRNGRYGLGLGHFLRSLCLYPYRPPVVVKRMVKTVISDIVGSSGQKFRKRRLNP